MSWQTLPENRLALRAIELLAAGEKTPLQMLLWGPPGTGKTRLATRWLKRLREKKPEARLLRVSSQELSLRLRGVFVPPGQQAPKSKLGSLRLADALVLEDLHRLATKRSVALGRLLDHRLARGRATLITSREPIALLSLDEGARGRLASGLVAAIKPLSLPSRMKALNKLAPVGRKRLTETTLEWLARQSGSSWRGLGAVAKAMKARLAAEGPVLEHPAGKRLLADLEKPRLRAPDLIRLTAKHFGVTEAALKGKGRQPSLVLARQVTMTLLRRHTELSLEKIGGMMGGRDSATVRHSLAKMDKTTHPMAVNALLELGRRVEG